MVRSLQSRQRRKLDRLTVSISTLLKLKFTLPNDLNHSLPIPPAEALRLLERLSRGKQIDLEQDNISELSAEE